MEYKARFFGLNKNVMSFLHHVVLFAMLHSTFVAPAQGIIEAYVNKEKKEYSDFSYVKYNDTESEEINNISPSFKNQALFSNTLDKKVVSDNIHTLWADIKEGVIGVSKDKPLDNPSDNLFKVNIDKLPLTGTKAYLSYEVFGVANHQSVARSINDRLSVGGNLIKKQQAWSVQKEEIDISWLKQGENNILFTIIPAADYQYKIRNLSIVFEKNKEANTLLVLNNQNVVFTKENKIYIKGFIRGNYPEAKIEASGTFLQVSNGEFEGYVTLTEEIKKNKFIFIKATDKNNFLGQEILFIDNLIESDSFFPLERKKTGTTKLFKAASADYLNIEGASISVTNSTLVRDYEISITALRSVDIPPMESGMVNVTRGGGGYRFLPDGAKFEKPVNISIEYDKALLPSGYSPKDIKTYFFDTHSKRWISVQKDSTDVKNQSISSKTTHFTDYINGIIQAPDSPETSAFSSTMMNDVKAADPSAEMTLINPPSASQNGDANISYPIKIPSGRNGLQPQLALQYSNEGGNGWLGQGWNLNIPALSIDTRWGVPFFDTAKETEIYSLNGEQLMYPDNYLPHRHQDGPSNTITTVMQNRNSSGTKLFYPRKQGSFAKIERLGTTVGTYYWKVTGTDGTISWYGGSTAQEVTTGNAVLKDASGRIVHWALSKVEDVYGNNMKYTYEKVTNTTLTSNLYKGQQLYLSSINYTGFNTNKGNYDIEFLRKTTRPDINISARLGIKQIDFHLLQEIRIKYKGELFRSYKLDYITGRFNKSLLKYATEYDGSGEEFYRHTFDYYDDIKQPDSTEAYFSASIEEQICAELPDTSVVDTDGDGVPDTEDQCDNTPGPISNNGCPEDNPGGSVNTDPETGEKLYCYEVFVNLPLKNERYKYSILGFGENPVGSCASLFRPFRFKSITLNGINSSAVSSKLFATHYTTAGITNLCPGYPITATDSENPDPAIRNTGFELLTKTWLQSPLTPFLDTNSNLTVFNKAGMYIAGSSVININQAVITFESNIELLSGSSNWDMYNPTTGLYYHDTSTEMQRQIISAQGESVPVMIDGSNVSFQNFNLHDDFASFASAVETIYGGSVVLTDGSFGKFNLSKVNDPHSKIKFYNVNQQLSTITIGGIVYYFEECKNPYSENSRPASRFAANSVTNQDYSIEYEGSIPGGDPDCPSLLNLDFLIQGNIPSYNSAASILGSSKTEGYNLGAAVSVGIGCKFYTKGTTFGGQMNFSYDKSDSFSAMIDINGDGLDDSVIKGYNGSLFYSKHVVNRVYDANGQEEVTHTFLPYQPITGINNFYKANSSSKSTNFQATFGFGRFGGFAGIDNSTTKSENNVYFTDANGDGLPDIVKNGSVYFNRLGSGGNPEFIDNSMGSPNLVIVAAPKQVEVPDEYNEDDITIPRYDVVKVWEAPYTGELRMPLDIELLDTTQEVTVTIEARTKNLTDGGACLLYGAKLDSSNPHIQDVLTDSFTCSHQSFNLGVNQGTRIYFRVHSNDGKNPKIKWNPQVEYTSHPNDLDQNSLSPYVYNYADDFLLSKKEHPCIFPGTGTASISWNNITVTNPSDTVVFEIYKAVLSNSANDNFENNGSVNSQAIYKKTCPANTTTLVSTSTNEVTGAILNSIAITSNDTPGSNNTSTVFYFKITSDSNVKWKQMEWKPQIVCVTQETVIGVNGSPEGTVTTNETLYPIPDFSTYMVYNKEWDEYAPGTFYQKLKSSTFPLSGTNSLLILPTLSGLFMAGDHGVINFVVKKNGVLKGKRKITISGTSVGLDSTIPIDLGPKDNEAIEIGFYSDDSALNENTPSILERLYFANANVAKVAFNMSSGPYYNIKDSQVNLFHIPSPIFGTMYRQWGQFAYNPDQVANATPSPFGNLINRNYLVINQNPTSVQNAIDDLDSMGENITVEQLEDFEDDNASLYAKMPFLSMLPKREMINSQYADKWTGSAPQNYASPDGYRAAGMDEVADEYIDNEDLIEQAVLQTGAYGINKYSKGKSRNVAAGANLDVTPTIGVGASGSKSLNATNNSLTDYIDLNGDRYPDIFSTDEIQYTLKTGGLKTAVPSHSSLDGTTGVEVGKASNESWGVSAAGSFSMGGKPVDLSGTSRVRFVSFKGNSGAGISGNFSKGKSETSRMWADINGDGLADILEKNGSGTITARLNMGNNVFQDMQPNAASWAMTEMFNSTSESYGGGIGFNKWNGSFEAGVSLGTGRNNVINMLRDMNGDGIADLVNSDDNGILVKINKGNGFDSQVRWSDYRLNYETESSMSSKNGGATGALVIPIPLTSICFKLALNFNGSDFTSTNRVKKSISDFDGDGFPDLIEEISNSKVKVSYSNIRRTNMLKSVKNPLGGQFTVDYKVITPTYNNPNPKWVLTSVVVEDGYDLANDGVDSYNKTFEYENGYYDRRERDFYGYETVRTIDHTVDEDGEVTGVYRTAVSVYHNRSYYLHGLVKWSYVMKGNNPAQIFSRTVNSYNLRKLDSNGLIITTGIPLPLAFDTGGEEGRRAAAPLLTSTQNYVYEFGQTPLVTTTTFTYNKYGAVLEYKDLAATGTADDYKTTITYHDDAALLAKNMVALPKSVLVNAVTGNVLMRKRETSVNTTTGDVTKIVVTLNGTESANTDLEYDIYGNVKKVTLPANETAQRMTYTYTYDTSDNKYIIKTVDAYNYTSSATYNAKFDKVLSTTDITGNLMKYTYDTFGRLINVLAPNEITASKPYTIKFDYYPKYADLPEGTCVDEPEQFMPFAVTKHFDVQHTTNDIETITIMDGLARPVQVKKDIQMNMGTSSSPVLQERMSVSGMVTYDEFGRAIRQYHPWHEAKLCQTNQVFNSTTTAYYSETTFDEMDRPLKVKDPDGNATDYTYAIAADGYGTSAQRTKTTVANTPNPTITEVYKDITGKVTSTKNVLTGTTTTNIWTKFAYDAVGNVKNYTDAASIITSYTYDLAGRKISMSNPDTGLTTYVYDTAGNMIKLQTANLAATTTLPAADRYIKYQYEYNRIKAIKYPPVTSGANIANVDYLYGTSTAGNNTGRLISQKDATGTQDFAYGKMGEMITNTRTVVGPNIPTRTFVTKFTYDSWNRVISIIYPDNEKVNYNYDLGGNLTGIVTAINPSVYVQRIDYDYFGQRVFIKYGNNATTSYVYTDKLRRLDQLSSKTAANQSFASIQYTYDKIGNVIKYENTAVAVPSNEMGGKYLNNYAYDNLSRLTSSTGTFKGDLDQEENNNDFDVSYSTTMVYNTTHGITKKTQTHSKDSAPVAANTYQDNYTYIAGTHKLQKVVDAATTQQELFSYDANGNILTRTIGTVSRKLFWDESNRLRAVVDNSMQHNIYDAAGERVLKATADAESLYTNGMPVDGSITFDAYTTYPSGYIVVDGGGKYTKHYYAGSQRVLSRLGDKDAEIFEVQSKMAASQSEGEPLDEDELRQSQIADLTQILIKADMGTPVFKEYEQEEEEAAPVDGPEDSRSQEATTQLLAPPPGNLYYYHPDHLGSSTFLTDANGEVYQFYLNLPFGETMAEQHSLTEDYETPYKFNAKELDTDTGYYYYGARYYNPRISIWLSADPLMEKYPNVNPYAYCAQNPVNLTDPTGMAVEPPTDFTFNVKTGQVTQVGDTNDKPDRILKTNRKGEIKYDSNGEAKVAVDGIEKGILKDGMNLKNESNVFEVGGDGQASVEGIEKFSVQLTEIVGKEIGLAYYSKDDVDPITHITMGDYGSNGYKDTNNHGQTALRKISKTTKDIQSFVLRDLSHTHPYRPTRFVPSDNDKKARDRDLKMNPNLRFHILTMPEGGSGNKYPLKIDY